MVLSFVYDFVFAGALLSAVPSGAASSSYLYRAATLQGSLQSSWARLAYDYDNAELYAFSFGDGTVRIFNDAGMQTHSFGDDASLGVITAVAPLANGDMVTLSRRRGRTLISMCDFRGSPKREIFLQGVPASVLKDFRPLSVGVAGERLYLNDPIRMRVIITRFDGRYDRHVDLAEVLGFDAHERTQREVDGLTVDRRGNILFTIPSLFTAALLTPEGKLKSFGDRGSAPGLFNIVSGIATDERGLIYVTDVLRSVVMVFAPNFEFLTEFGYRGGAPSSLSSPASIVASGGKVFVSQSMGQGISVFRLSWTGAKSAPEPSPSPSAYRAPPIWGQRPEATTPRVASVPYPAWTSESTITRR